MDRVSRFEGYVICSRVMRRNTALLLSYLLAKKRGRRLKHISIRNLRVRYMLLQRWIIRRQQRNYWRQARRRRWWVRPLLEDHDTLGAWSRLIPNMRRFDPEEFYAFHRMTVQQFDDLLDLCAPFLTKSSLRKPISAGERLSITLRCAFALYLASGDNMISLKYLYLVSKASLSNIIRETCYVIWHCLKPRVFQSINQEYWYKVASDFEAIWDFPHCTGAIDGKHCVIQAIPHSGSKNYNYKSAHSFVLMAVCDAKHRFISVDVGAPGSINDASIFNQSSFGKCLYNGSLGLPRPSCPDGSTTPLPYGFVGDGIFPLRTDLMVPYEGRFLSPDQAIYNYRLSRARHIIENAFGVLTTRMRALRHTMIGCAETIKGVVLASVALHNRHLLDEEWLSPKEKRYIPPKYVDHFDKRGKLLPGRWRREDKGLSRSLFFKLKRAPSAEVGDPFDVRESFNDYFIDHPVSWQWKVLPHNGVNL